MFELAAAAKGFGGGGGGGSMASSNKKRTKPKKGSSGIKTKTPTNPKPLLKHVQQKYGGTTPQEIAIGTQSIIDRTIQTLPQHLQEALPLYRQVLEWNRRLVFMDLLEQSQLQPSILQQHQRVQQTLDRLLADHNLTLDDLQVTMQQITWDASADAKAVKSLMGSMSQDIQRRVQVACQHAAEAIADVGGGSSDNVRRDCLDVGCGYGVLVPYLHEAGIASGQIHGVDLSSEMIRNARSFYPDVQFDVANFMEFNHDDRNDEQQQHLYKAIIFCASLHDMPDMKRSLLQARSLLHCGGGRLIVVHPQGATHVAEQHRSNPVMVPRGLPTAEELMEWLCNDDVDVHGNESSGSDRDGNVRPTSMELLVEPAEARSERESRDGYLAVLRKV